MKYFKTQNALTTKEALINLIHSNTTLVLPNVPQRGIKKSQNE